MGFVKQEWIEMEERGYKLPDDGKYVCSSHIDDVYLQKFINDGAIDGICNYCGKHTRVVELRGFLEHVCTEITRYYNNPSREDLPLASSFYDDEEENISGAKRVGKYIIPSNAASYDSTRELLASVNLITDNIELDRDIEDCFLWDEWIQTDAFHMTEGQELSFSWNLFVRMVKYRQRFTFFRRDDLLSESEFEDYRICDILEALERKITILNLIQVVDSESIIYRCRFIDDGEEVNSFGQITSAPNHKAKQNRMSPAGISMFYGNFEKSTAVLESSPDGMSTVGRYVVGEFKTRKPLRVLDLTILPEYSFWMPGDKDGVKFLDSFNREVTKQINRDDIVHIEYVPSQIFTEYLRCIYKYEGKAIDGIVYRSSLESGMGKNIVLFYDQIQSARVLELVAISDSKSVQDI